MILLDKKKANGNGTSDLIPRGSTREQLHDAGQIANLVELSMSWTEEEVYRQLESRFAIMDMTKPFPRYQVQSNNNIIIISL